MKKRTITGIIMLSILAPLFLIPNLFIGLGIVVGVLIIIAMYELLKLDNKKYDLKTLILIYGSTTILYLLFILQKYNLDQNILLELIDYKIIIGIMFISSLFLLLTVINPNFTIIDFSKVISYILYVVFGLGSLVLLRIVGVQFIIYLFLTTMFTDIFAYLFGIKFGKHKMAPTISPKKSWEGAISGTVIATIVVGLLGTFYGFIFKGNIFNVNEYRTILDGFEFLSHVNNVGKGLLIFILTFILSIIGQFGDLVASRIKRVYDTKDFGNIFPGHGGVLDRFDSAMFSGMFLVMILMILSVL